MPDMNKARTTLAAFQNLINATPDDAANIRIRPEAWTLTEIIGHLVDSASNNHQRFARLQFGSLENFPAYEAEPWVESQQYSTYDFRALRTLWTSYNELLLHIAENSPQSTLSNGWVREDGTQSLDFLINDYYAHMQLHVDHYEKRLEEVMQAREIA
jgi:hypothetical protein